MEHVNWGWPIALDLFLAAMGAGAFMLAVMADLAGGRRYRLVSGMGALVAPWPVICGVLLLVVDLGQPHRFWEMMLRRGEDVALEFPFLMFNVTSTMSIGTWLLTAFVWISLAYILVTILAYPFRWVNILKKLVGVIGLPVALLVTIYTGVLLSASPNPLWNNFALPVVFVASALVTGAALVICVLAVLRVLGFVTEESAHIPKLERLNGGVIVVQILAVAAFIFLGLGSAPMLSVIGAGYGPLWWIGVVGLGLLLPLIVGLKGGLKRPQFSLVVSALVLLGGLFLRYVVVMAGQGA